METNFILSETNLEELGLLVLDENETMEIEGGGHYELIDGKLVYVKD